MINFDRLNQQTRDWNNGITRNISPTDNLNSTRGFNRLNGDTFYSHNGQYSKHYF